MPPRFITWKNAVPWQPAIVALRHLLCTWENGSHLVQVVLSVGNLQLLLLLLRYVFVCGKPRCSLSAGSSECDSGVQLYQWRRMNQGPLTCASFLLSFDPCLNFTAQTEANVLLCEFQMKWDSSEEYASWLPPPHWVMGKKWNLATHFAVNPFSALVGVTEPLQSHDASLQHGAAQLDS